MSKIRPTYKELENRLAASEPIVEALKNHEVDAVVGGGKIAYLLLHKVEEQLLESNEEFRAMFDLSGVGMFQADPPAFRFTRVNSKFCQITGYSAEELLTKTYIGLTDPQDRLRDMKELTRVLRANTDSWSVEKRCVRKDGTVVWVDVNGVALRGATGRVVRIMAMISDITPLKRAEQKLSDRSAEKGRPTRQKKAAVKKLRKSVSRKSSDKPRPKRR